MCIFYPIVCKWLPVNVTRWAFKLLSYSLWPVWRFGSTAGYLLDKHVLKAANYSTCIPAIWCWMSHPENVKKQKQWKDDSNKVAWLPAQFAPYGETAINTQGVRGLNFSALRWPSFGGSEWTQLTPRKSTQGKRMDCLMKMIQRLAQEKAMFKKE